MTNPEFYCPELLSALVDGELDMGAADAGLREVLQSNTVQSKWNNYQVIGHAIRNGAGCDAQLGADSAFLQRLNTRIADEKIIPQLHFSHGNSAISLLSQPAANEDVFRWKWWPVLHL